MAEIKLVGDALVIESSVTMEEWKLVNKYHPDALVLTEGEDKTPVFRVGIGTDGGFSKYGIVFTGETHGEKKYATFTTGFIVRTEKDIKEAVAEYVGSAILKLNKLEASIPGVIEEIEEEKKDIMRNITVQ